MVLDRTSVVEYRFSLEVRHMAETESQWALSELENESGPMVIRKLLDAIPHNGLSGDDYVIYMTIGCKRKPTDKSFYTKTDSATLAEIDSTDIPELEAATGALLVGVVSAPMVRDFIFYSRDPQRFLDLAGSLQDRYSQFQIGCECSPDPEWNQYFVLPPSES